MTGGHVAVLVVGVRVTIREAGDRVLVRRVVSIVDSRFGGQIPCRAIVAVGVALSLSKGFGGVAALGRVIGSTRAYDAAKQVVFDVRCAAASLYFLKNISFSPPIPTGTNPSSLLAQT